jgi:hypothetical protein
MSDGLGGIWAETGDDGKAGGSTNLGRAGV